MNITIKPGAATEDAQQISSIVSTITADMEECDKILKQLATGELNLDWADTLYEQWQGYFNSDIPEAMAEMQQSSTNLQTAVSAAIAYSQEQM